MHVHICTRIMCVLENYLSMFLGWATKSRAEKTDRADAGNACAKGRNKTNGVAAMRSSYMGGVAFWVVLCL